MPKKYNIPTKTARNRFAPVESSVILDWESGCLRCFRCVKKQCIYNVYNKRTFDTKQMCESTDSLCKNCLRCVQSCPAQIITKTSNPEYNKMGNVYWTPDVISRQWLQAETGKVPVSGAGYGGPFSGPGFDDMWTDMSEIVRPTRDGIHGREYISTLVDLGRNLPYLQLDESGRFSGNLPRIVEIPVPIIFKELPFGYLSDTVIQAMAEAAGAIGTFLIVPYKMLDAGVEPYKKHLIPLIRIEDAGKIDNLHGFPIVEVEDAGKDGTENFIGLFRERNDGLLMARAAFGPQAEDRALRLTDAGVDILHFHADMNGNVDGGNLFVKDTIRAVHMGLVKSGMRDNVTIMISGGVAMAEHVAKSILCGADAVAVDLPLLLALECRLCFQCQKGLPCPVEIENIEVEWGKTRIMNLIAAWRNQLLEVLGAMGIREVRRLRGEVGRAMFFKDLETDTFGKLFGKRKS